MRDIDNYEQMYSSAEMDFETYQVMYRRKRVLESLKKVSGGTIVEIGCGEESIFNYYHDFERFICIEPGERFYKKALKMAKDNDSITIINDYFENVISQLDKDVDCIICSSLLHEVENPLKLLTCIWEASGKNTMVHINVPNAKSFHRLLAICSGIIGDEHDMSDNNIMLQQHAVFDLFGLCEMIESVRAIEVLEKGSYFVKPFTHKQMKECMEKGIIDRDILDGLYNIVKYIPGLGSEIFVDFRWEM